MTRSKLLAITVTVVASFAAASAGSAQFADSLQAAGTARPSVTAPPAPPVALGTSAWSILTATERDLDGMSRPDRATSRWLDDSASHLRAALAPSLWSHPLGDGNHLDVRLGGRAFDQSGQAVSAMRSIRAAPSYLASSITTNTGYVVYATRLLATTAIADNSCTPRKASMLDIARRLIARGDTEFDKAHPVLAVTHYGNAWWHAIKARGAACAATPRPFTIAGSVTDLLYPGASRPIDLVFTNPNDVPITVQSVVVSVDPVTSRTSCDGPPNLVVTQSLVGTITVPAGATRSLSELAVPQDRWPVLRMPDLPVNQDACQATTFTMHYTGTATG